jgi:hypothetical protein
MSILKKYLKRIAKNLSYKTVLIKSNKNVKCPSYTYYVFVITHICKPMLVTFGWIGTWRGW